MDFPKPVVHLDLLQKFSNHAWSFACFGLMTHDVLLSLSRVVIWDISCSHQPVTSIQQHSDTPSLSLLSNMIPYMPLVHPCCCFCTPPPSHHRRRFTKLHHFTSQSVSAEPPPPPASGLHGGTFPCRRPSITKISPWSPSANYHISSAVTHVIITASTRLSTDGNYILFSLFHN